jgi:hypothetical protein
LSCESVAGIKIQATTEKVRYNCAMGEPPFAPAITGPIDDPRHLRPDIAAELFDEQTRARIERLASALRFSVADLIREGTMRYIDQLEHPPIEVESTGPDAGAHLR